MVIAFKLFNDYLMVVILFTGTNIKKDLTNTTISIEII